MLNQFDWICGRLRRVQMLNRFITAMILILVGTWVPIGPNYSFGQIQDAAEELTVEVQVNQEDEEVEEDFEEDVEGQAADFVNQFGVDPAKMAAAKRFQLAQDFAVEIDEITRVCKLDKKQVLKLKIGAKGAAKKLVAEWRKMTAQQFGMEPPVAADEQADKNQDVDEVEVKDADEIDEMTLQMLQFSGGNPYRSSKPTESEFWTKTVASVLTQPQTEQLESYQKKRSDAKNNARLAMVMETLTIELALTADQRTKLETMVATQFEDAEINCNLMYEPYLIYYYASKVSSTELEELLSANQHQKWKMFMAPMRQMGQILEMSDDQHGELQLSQVQFEFGFLDSAIQALEGIVDVIDQAQQGIWEFFGW